MEVGRGGEMVSSGVCAGEGRGEIDGRRRMSGRSGGEENGGKAGSPPEQRLWGKNGGNGQRGKVRWRWGGLEGMIGGAGGEVGE